MMWPSFTKTFHSKTYPSVSPTRPELSAKDKVILVTGAGSGIGKAVAIVFAQADARAVVLCGRRLEPLSKAQSEIEALGKGTRVRTLQLDVTDESKVQGVFEKIKGEFGEVDIVINSAGHLSEPGSLKETSTSNFWTSFEINVKGSFLLSQAFLRHCTSSLERPKTLLLLSSLICHFPASANISAPASYGISKLAEAKLAEYVAAEASPGFRAYALHPGNVVTDMSDRSVAMAPDPEGLRAALEWDDAELSAGFMLWLSSKRGECIPSGRFLWINWDVDELEESSENWKDPNLLTMGLHGWSYQF